MSVLPGTCFGERVQSGLLGHRLLDTVYRLHRMIPPEQGGAQAGGGCWALPHREDWPVVSALLFWTVLLTVPAGSFVPLLLFMAV